MATPRSTVALTDMIRADLRLIQNPAETWAQMRDMKFSESYHRGLLNAGVPASKADEIASMVRQYISRISAGLETATYMLKELASEVDEARRLSGARLSDDGFRV